MEGQKVLQRDAQQLLDVLPPWQGGKWSHAGLMGGWRQGSRSSLSCLCWFWESGLEVGVTALLTWLTRCSQMQALGLVVQDKHVKVITTPTGKQCKGQVACAWGGGGGWWLCLQCACWHD